MTSLLGVGRQSWYIIIILFVIRSEDYLCRSLTTKIMRVGACISTYGYCVPSVINLDVQSPREQLLADDDEEAEQDVFQMVSCTGNESIISPDCSYWI